jgi:Na+/proline symporter
MNLASLGLIALAVYLGALAVVAALARRARRDETPSDHFLAARDLGVFVLFLTLYATAYSGNSLLGYPGEAYRLGFRFVVATGFMMSIMVVFHALVPRLRRISVSEGFVTPGDWVRYRFTGEPWAGALVLAVGLLMTIALGNFLLAQLTAMGHVTSQVTGGVIPYAVGVLGLAIVILLYETLGGMRAVAWTDAAQGILMMLGLATLAGWLMVEAGGLAEVTRHIAEVRPEAVAVPDARETANWASRIVLLGLASVIYPQAIQRIYAARNGATLRRSFALMTFMPLTTTLVVTLIGLAAIPRFEALGVIEADTVMPLLLSEWAASGLGAAILAVLVFVGALAAIMSTTDSVLLSLGSLIAEDLLGRPSGDPRTTRIGKWAAALVLGVTLILAFAPRFTLWRLIELKMELLIQCVPAFLLGIHWAGLRARPTLCGLLVGTGFAVTCVGVDVTQMGGVHVGVIGLGLNLLICLAGSRIEGHRGGSGPSRSLRYVSTR